MTHGINIDDLTLGQVKSLQSLVSGTPQAITESHWPIGKPFFVRTVTHIITGELVAVTSQEFVLKDAAWVADTGRYSGAIESGVFSEVEPYPAGQLVFVGRGAMIDATEIPSLPRVQK